MPELETNRANREGRRQYLRGMITDLINDIPEPSHEYTLSYKQMMLVHYIHELDYSGDRDPVVLYIHYRLRMEKFHGHQVLHCQVIQVLDSPAKLEDLPPEDLVAEWAMTKDREGQWSAWDVIAKLAERYGWEWKNYPFFFSGDYLRSVNMGAFPEKFGNDRWEAIVEAI